MSTNGNDIDVDWTEARDANRTNWDDRVPLHESAYGLEAHDDPDYRSDVVATDLPVLRRFVPGGTLDGLDLCHLQCHIGTDTVSLAREGARVTGVDFSAPALASAEALAERIGVEATWVETDVLDARAAVTGDFDVVYTSIGTICWLRDLDRWAAQIAGLLRPGGTFYIRDGHPALQSLDETAPDLRIRYRYFPNGRGLQWDDAGTYIGDGTVTHTRTYEFPHSLAEIVTALLAAGLRLDHLGEDTLLPWKFTDRMVDVPLGYALPEDERDRVPMTFTIVATKAGATEPDATTA
jgi:SAM-dependent methyltransferase